MEGLDFCGRMEFLKQFRDCNGDAVKIAFGHYCKKSSKELTVKEIYEILYNLHYCNKWIREVAEAQSGNDYAKFKEIYERLKVDLPSMILMKIIFNFKSLLKWT